MMHNDVGVVECPYQHWDERKEIALEGRDGK